MNLANLSIDFFVSELKIEDVKNANGQSISNSTGGKKNLVVTIKRIYSTSQAIKLLSRNNYNFLKSCNKLISLRN